MTLTLVVQHSEEIVSRYSFRVYVAVAISLALIGIVDYLRNKIILRNSITRVMECGALLEVFVIYLHVVLFFCAKRNTSVFADV